MFLITITITIIIIGFGFSHSPKEHYKVEEIKDSSEIGKVYYIEKPLIYIKNLSKCNKVSKNIALNTSCLFSDKSEFKIEEINNSCTGCLSLNKSRMPVPLKVELKEKTTLKVVGVFSTYNNYDFWGNNVTYKHFLFIDQDGIYIEVPFYIIDSGYGVMSEEAKPKSKEISSIISKSSVVKNICYYEKDAESVANNKNKIIKMLSDFELSDSIKLSDSTCNKRGMKKNGLVISTKNLNDFLTFYYFKKAWQISGEMY